MTTWMLDPCYMATWLLESPTQHCSNAALLLGPPTQHQQPLLSSQPAAFIACIAIAAEPSHYAICGAVIIVCSASAVLSSSSAVLISPQQQPQASPRSSSCDSIRPHRIGSHRHISLIESTQAHHIRYTRCATTMHPQLIPYSMCNNHASSADPARSAVAHQD